MLIASINPATGETIKTFAPLSEAQLDEKLQHAAETFATYRRTSLAERERRLQSAAEILETEKHDFARLMTIEMGKPIKGAVGEVEKCAWVCRYYAETAKQHLADQLVQTDAARSFVRFQPLGPVLAVMPWNFPFWQVFRFAAPALMAGNVGLLKHASNVPQCAVAIEDIFRRAGFPTGAFQTLLVGSEVVQRILEDRRVAAATLTGSEPAGRSVAGIAGKLIKKTVLELGGSDPFIVMPSAEMDAAVSTAVKARTINNGQSCIAAKRFIVADQIYDEFERRFVETMKALRVGDPLKESTDIGPLATEQILKDVDEQVKTSVAAGAHLLTGGKKINGPGNFYEPTVLASIASGSPAYCEEVFGPVALLFRVMNIDDAIQLANATTFGLGAAAWTKDASEQERFVDEIEAGCVFINGMVASDPRLPFGGIKHSGYGRELGEFGIREFVNIKTVWVK
ncbi:MAG TPA: NADP-dependent succinic semialdehyde dehydrogenase [Blastocatellia bacterium]|jgi:succinate-semialdehyde dehydrogenase/glutarate-semialdehyde dehydrogenase|nr:NADP-dependent succinic semialdehyde dehydrogenase [Blastocatellia bacterium]HAF24773.1 NADP-dependent succinic semialdehyde dehydrogenase [Blastocatellia bacterium]HCX31995.1 NADP-dependent succinic semialdehyde dehydrogenase [Blastocatellia bacterium]